MYVLLQVEIGTLSWIARACCSMQIAVKFMQIDQMT